MFSAQQYSWPLTGISHGARPASAGPCQPDGISTTEVTVNSIKSGLQLPGLIPQAGSHELFRTNALTDRNLNLPRHHVDASRLPYRATVPSVTFYSVPSFAAPNFVARSINLL